MAETNSSSRYQRQMLLPGMGDKGQALLQEAKLLVIGAGGLGCPALQYLVAAGVGTIGIADGDSVDISNLHRQMLYSTEDIGGQKVLIAKQKLNAQNPGCNIIAHPFFLHQRNAWEILEEYDIVLDGSDNFSTRYLVNDICVLQKKPLVYGAVHRFEGQVAVFNVTLNGTDYSSQYRDIFPDPPQPGTTANCNTAGVLGVLPGIIGTMQAMEVIKLITGIGEPLINKLLTYNALTNNSFALEIAATNEGLAGIPADRSAIENHDYDIACDSPANSGFITIDAAVFEQMIAHNGVTIVDVREDGELPAIGEFEHLKIPMSEINTVVASQLAGNVILICQSGTRSRQAASLVSKSNNIQSVYSLDGGILSWIEFKNRQSS